MLICIPVVNILFITFRDCLFLFISYPVRLGLQVLLILLRHQIHFQLPWALCCLWRALADSQDSLNWSAPQDHLRSLPRWRCLLLTGHLTDRPFDTRRRTNHERSLNRCHHAPPSGMEPDLPTCFGNVALHRSRRTHRHCPLLQPNEHFLKAVGCSSLSSEDCFLHQDCVVPAKELNVSSHWPCCFVSSKEFVAAMRSCYLLSLNVKAYRLGLLIEND
jgi:hypothetical protein